MSVEILDIVADSYIPLLLVLAVVTIFTNAKKNEGKDNQYIPNVGLLGLLIITAYCFMFVDAKYKMWFYFGLDYSTHTAVALSVIIFLCFSNRRFSIAFCSSFISYLALMIYQGYHTLPDIVTTLVGVFFVLMGVVFLYLKQIKKCRKKP